MPQQVPGRDTMPELSSPSSSDESSGRLHELVVQVLGIAIDRACEGTSRDGCTNVVRGMLGEICATARANDLRVEALILDFKSTWWRLPEAHGAARHDAEIALAEVITLCIKEYYAPGSASTRSGAATRSLHGRNDLHLT